MEIQIPLILQSQYFYGILLTKNKYNISFIFFYGQLSVPESEKILFIFFGKKNLLRFFTQNYRLQNLKKQESFK
jgi:hypothetical protein